MIDPCIQFKRIPPPSLFTNTRRSGHKRPGFDDFTFLGRDFEPFCTELRRKGVLFPIGQKGVTTTVSYPAAALDGMSIELTE